MVAPSRAAIGRRPSATAKLRSAFPGMSKRLKKPDSSHGPVHVESTSSIVFPVRIPAPQDVKDGDGDSSLAVARDVIPGIEIVDQREADLDHVDGALGMAVHDVCE